jgi:MFS transporter, ACS family, allantoate permease
MPDSPNTAWFLTEKEKILVIERIRQNQQGVGNKKFKRYQFWEALRDPMAWSFMFFLLTANIPNGGKSRFGIYRASRIDCV